MSEALIQRLREQIEQMKESARQVAELNNPRLHKEMELAVRVVQLEAAHTRQQEKLRALVEKWRAEADRHRTHGDCYRKGQGWGLGDCADDLAALLAEGGPLGKPRP